MKPSPLYFPIMLSVFFLSCRDNQHDTTNAEMSSTNAEAAVVESVNAWAKAFTAKDYIQVLNLFDTTDANIMLVGSDSSEVFTGKEQIGAFMQAMFSQPFSLTWEFKSIKTFQHQGTAWAFVSAALNVAEGEHVMKLNYRFAVVLAEINKQWKWKLYHGSEPKPQ